MMIIIIVSARQWANVRETVNSRFEAFIYGLSIVYTRPLAKCVLCSVYYMKIDLAMRIMFRMFVFLVICEFCTGALFYGRM